MNDVQDFTERLARECQKAGLTATVLGPARVHVSAPGAHARLAETVRCVPDAEERLTWHWSWGEPICPAADIAGAVRLIAHVVTPPASSPGSPPSAAAVDRR
jgi:hypothetical protein